MVHATQSPPTGKGLESGALTLAGNVVIGVSSVAPAYSLAAAMAGLVAVVGPKGPSMFIIGFIPMMLTAFAFRELARETPDCGATFTWVTRAFGPWVGWIAGWASLVAAIIGIGNGAQVAAIYLLKALGFDELANSTAAQLTLGAMAVLALLAISLRGITLTERTQALLLSLQIGMLVLVSVVALVKVWTHHAGAQATMPQWNWLLPTGLSSASIAHASILCVFAYWGWDTCLNISEETQHPHKNPGKAAVLATILMLATYVLVSYAIQAFAGFGKTGIGLKNPDNANDALSVLGKPVVGPALAVLLLLAICSSSLSSALTCLAPMARNMLAMSVYHALPRRFATVHPRYRTPWPATIALGVTALVGYTALTLVNANSLADMVESVGLATAFYYAMTAYACVWTFRHTMLRSARNVWLRGIFPLLGAATMTWAFIQSAVDMFAPDYGKTHLGPVGGTFLMGIGLLALGIPLAALCLPTGRDFFRGETLNANTEIVVQ